MTKFGKICFVHDHRFRVQNNNSVYSTGAYSTKVWDRYLQISNELIVAGRSIQLDGKADVGGLRRVDYNFVEFEYFENLLTPKGYIFTRPSVKRKMRKLIQSCDAAVIRLPSELGLMAVKVSIELGKPYLIELAGDVYDSLWHRGTLAGKAYTPIQTLRTRIALKNAKYSVYVTKHALQKRYPTNGASTHASNVVLDSICLKAESARHQFNALAKPVFTFGIIGPPQLRVKGVHLAIEALNLCSKLGQKVELRLLGPGDNEAVRDYVDKLNPLFKVSYDGTRPTGQPVYEWLDEIDVYLQPSYQEGLPRALIEAMSRGCVAIGSDVCGIPELLDERVIFRRGKAQELADKIMYVLSNKHVWNELSTSNTRVASEYLESKINMRRADLFAKLLNENQTTRP